MMLREGCSLRRAGFVRGSNPITGRIRVTCREKRQGRVGRDDE